MVAHLKDYGVWETKKKKKKETPLSIFLVALLVTVV